MWVLKWPSIYWKITKIVWDSQRNSSNVTYSLFQNSNSSFRQFHILSTYLLWTQKIWVNPIEDGLFPGCSRMRGWTKSTFLKFCHTYPIMMKLDTVAPYLKTIQKAYKSSYTFLEFCWHQHFFHRKSATFFELRNPDIYCSFMHSLYFFKSSKVVSINMVAILGKLPTLGFLKIKVLWHKGYDVIIFVENFTNKLLSRDSNYIVDMAKFGISNISMREIIITSLL